MGSIFDATSQIALLLQLFAHCQITISKSPQSSNSFLLLFLSFCVISSDSFHLQQYEIFKKCPFNHELYVQCRIIYIISFFTWQTFNTIIWRMGINSFSIFYISVTLYFFLFYCQLKFVGIVFLLIGGFW